MRTAGRRGTPNPRMPAHGEPRNDDALTLLAGATVAVVLVSAALARHLGTAALDAARAALGRPRTAPVAATGPEETLARAVRSLL